MKNTEENVKSKREFKKQINIKWNSRLFFQLGLIASLLFVFFIMQTDFEVEKKITADRYTSTNIEEPPMIDYVLDIEKPKPIESIKKVVAKQMPIQKINKSDAFDVKPNNTTDIETPIASIDAPVVNTTETTKQPIETPTVTRTVMNVEFVPVFPGCEPFATNAEKIDCMSSKINDFINKNFRKDVLERLSPNEKHKIYVKFKIDSNGFITEVVANSHNANLKKEAQRVVNNLPTMKPGKQGDKNVDVVYTIPIVFQVY